ncbi:MAG: WD40 repeat domain-containing protein [Planctomycetes bacterium]|nr:WD40 repeat domain-containing protein [Planctomycetota bacterium]
MGTPIFSADGTAFAAHLKGHEAGVGCWETATGKLLADVRDKVRIDSFDLSSDGRLLAVASSSLETRVRSSRQVFEVLSTSSGKRLWRARRSGEENLQRVAFSGRAKVVAGVTRKGALAVYDASGGDLIATSPAPTAEGLGFLGSGLVAQVAGATKTPAAAVLEANGTWTLVPLSFAGLGSPRSFAVSRDGRHVAYAPRPIDTQTPGTVFIHDLASGQIVQEIQAHTLLVNSMAFSADGQTLATGGGDQSVKLWRVATGEDLNPSLRHWSSVTDVSWSPDGKAIATVDRSGTLIVWSSESFQPIRRVQPEPLQVAEAGSSALSWSPDGAVLALSLSGSSGTRLNARVDSVWLFETKPWRARAPLPGFGKTAPGSLEFSAGSRELTFAPSAGFKAWTQRVDNSTSPVESARYYPLADTVVELDDTGWVLRKRGGPQTRRLPASLLGGGGSVVPNTLSPDGRLAVHFNGRGQEDLLRVVDLDAKGYVITVPRPEPDDGFVRVTDAAFSSDGGRLAVSFSSGEIRVWSTATASGDPARPFQATAKELVRFKLHPGQYAGRLAFSPDGMRLVTGGLWGAVHVWKIPAE